MRVPLLLLLTAIALVATPSVEAAPVERTVADRFEIQVGHQHEPAILGDTNGIRIQITENNEPVPSADTALVAEVDYMGAVRVLNLTETEPGVYVGAYIPMQTGDFSYRLTGSIDGVEINETFTVADGLTAVAPRTDYEFPNAAHGFGPATLAVPAVATALVGAGMYLWSKRSAR